MASLRSQPAAVEVVNPIETNADIQLESSNRVTSAPHVGVALITGGFDRPYAFGLSMALASKDVSLEVIGGDEIDSPEMHSTPKLKFLNFYGDPRRQRSLADKASRILKFYGRLFRYAFTAKPKIIHILWNNKFPVFDRTLLMLYYKLLRKKVVFTAHNVNAGRRDGNDSFLNRLSLKAQYRLANHIFVHTEKMKTELVDEYGIQKQNVTVIPFGINNAVPNTALSSTESKKRLAINNGERSILFFGAIRPYKGLEHLVAAFQRIAKNDETYRLIIAGESKKGSEDYLRGIQITIEGDASRERVIQKIEFIPDDETELYFKAADVLVLPYTEVFQSGVLFLAYSFGLPVIAANVGSFQDDIIPGETGYLCRSCNAEDMGEAIETYFRSDLYKTLDRRRQDIKDFANSRNSWDTVGNMTRRVYEELLRA